MHQKKRKNLYSRQSKRWRRSLAQTSAAVCCAEDRSSRRKDVHGAKVPQGMAQICCKLPLDTPPRAWEEQGRGRLPLARPTSSPMVNKHVTKQTILPGETHLCNSWESARFGSHIFAKETFPRRSVPHLPILELLLPSFSLLLLYGLSRALSR